jgi:hypothetical protein
MKQYEPVLQNQPVDVSEEFARQQNHFFIGSEVLEFDPSTAFGRERSLVRAGYAMTAHIGDITEYRDATTYYEGPAADLERLEEELLAHGQEIFVSALAILTEKLRDAMGGANE